MISKLPCPSDPYSRFVHMMRRVLPLLAIALGALLLIWPSLQQDPRALPPTSMGIREMTNLRYTGQNSNGEPMVVTAAHAVQVGKLENTVDLTTVSATLTRQSGKTVTISADVGRYNQEKNHLTLTDNVHLVDDDGYDLTTSIAKIDLNTPAKAWGNAPVSGTGPKGKVNAQGFKVTDAGKTVLFTGRSRLDLNDTKKATP